MVRGTTEPDKWREEDPLSAFAAEPPGQVNETYREQDPLSAFAAEERSIRSERSERLDRSSPSIRSDRSIRSDALESFDRFAESVDYAVRRSDRFRREIPSRFRQFRREYLEPVHERVRTLRTIRIVPVLAASAAGALLAVGTLAALNAVWARVAVQTERAAAGVADDRSVAIPPPTVNRPLEQASGVEPTSSSVDALPAIDVAAPVSRPASDADTNRSEAVIAALPAARQVVVAESARRLPPVIVGASAAREVAIEDALTRREEAPSTSAVQSATATSGVATVATPPGAATPIVSALGAVPASAAPALPLPSSPRAVMATAAIESVLGRYASAFSALDARGAKSVWPSVNERNLERAFSSLDRQEFELGSCDITVTPPRAVATCDGSARYVPKVGNKNLRSEPRRWTFRLQQSGADWMIEAVDTR